MKYKAVNEWSPPIPGLESTLEVEACVVSSLAIDGNRVGVIADGNHHPLRGPYLPKAGDYLITHSNDPDEKTPHAVPKDVFEKHFKELL